MEPETEPISADRPFEAAESVATVVMETAARGGGWIAIGGGDWPGGLEGFTVREVGEGLSFPIRLDIMETRESRPPPGRARA